MASGVGCVARQAVNGRGYHHVAGGELLHQCAKLRPVGRGAGDFLAEHFFASGRLQLGQNDVGGLVEGGAHPAVTDLGNAPVMSVSPD